MINQTTEDKSKPERKPYAAPAVNRVPLVPEELFVATCVKTPSICHPGQFGGNGHLKVKS